MLAVMLSAVLSVPYPQRPSSDDVVPPADCERYLGRACDNWKLATWLPDLSEREHQTPISFVDGFVFDGRVPGGHSFVEMQGAPSIGTPFTYGKAGPPRGVALYDAQQHIAFYGQGCCAWHGAVLALGVSPPPVPVQDYALDDVHTARGLFLGMTTASALRIYGNAPAEEVRDVPGVSVRTYRHALEYPCEQVMTLGFYRDQLIYIGIYNAC